MYKNMTKKDKTIERKIYVIGGDINYANWMEGQIVNKLEEATLIVFTGGEDWDASWYHKSENPPHETVGSNIYRDRYEMEFFKSALKLNKKMIGVCRGAQGGCVFAGGKLVQHQENPSFTHEIITFDGKRLITSSTHHQAQYPYNLKNDEYKVLAWTENYLKYRYLDSIIQDKTTKEVEIGYYPKINFLSIQGHMEMLYSDRDYNDNFKDSFRWHRDLLDKFMADDL